jgi:hypothetical protein
MLQMYTIVTQCTLLNSVPCIIQGIDVSLNFHFRLLHGVQNKKEQAIQTAKAMR